MQSDDKQFVSDYLAASLAVLTVFATDQAFAHKLSRVADQRLGWQIITARDSS